MSDTTRPPNGPPDPDRNAGGRARVERRDYPELAPTDRPRSRPRRFDDIYTDIVDYIVRYPQDLGRRDIGLIYTHYTHNCVLYGAMGTIYNREDVVRDTIQRLVSFPSAAAWPPR